MFVIFVIFVIGASLLSGCANETSVILAIENADTLNEAKKEVDNAIEFFNGYYLDLCDEVKNDFTKEDFGSLKTQIKNLELTGSKCKNLTSFDQNEVSNYAEMKIKENSNLHSLLSNRIECW